MTPGTELSKVSCVSAELLAKEIVRLELLAKLSTRYKTIQSVSKRYICYWSSSLLQYAILCRLTEINKGPEHLRKLGTITPYLEAMAYIIIKNNYTKWPKLWEIKEKNDNKKVTIVRTVIGPEAPSIFSICLAAFAKQHAWWFLLHPVLEGLDQNFHLFNLPIFCHTACMIPEVPSWWLQLD